MQEQERVQYDPTRHQVMKRRVVRVEAIVSLSLLFWLLQASYFDEAHKSVGDSDSHFSAREKLS